ncbi:hypothetical protein DFH27DRAFT_523174 [Peziza echinospora]|nr:hypothetical protein DFH27DRAFT_523174 [Peziza echinospora]
MAGDAREEPPFGSEVPSPISPLGPQLQLALALPYVAAPQPSSPLTSRFPLYPQSASATNLLETTTELLAPNAFGPRASIRQTKSSTSMRTSSGDAPRSSASSEPCHNPRASIGRKPVPSPLSLPRKPQPSFISPTHTLATPHGEVDHPQPNTPLSSPPRSPLPAPFSANSTPALEGSSTWGAASLTQPPAAPFTIGIIQRSKTPPLKSVFTSARRHAPDMPRKLNTSFLDDASTGEGESERGTKAQITSFFSPISSGSEDERRPTPKKSRSREGMVLGGLAPGSRKTTMVSGAPEVPNGSNIAVGSGGLETKKKKDKDGRRVSTFGTNHFRRLFERKDGANNALTALTLQPSTQSVANRSTIMGPSVASRVSSPLPFTRRKEKKEKQEKISPRDKDSPEESSKEKLLKISHPIPHPTQIDLVYAATTAPSSAQTLQPQQQTYSNINTTTSSPSIPIYAYSPSNVFDESIKSSRSPVHTRLSFGGSNPQGQAAARNDSPTSPLVSAITANQYNGMTPAIFPPSPPYTQSDNQGLKMANHARTRSAPNTIENPMRRVDNIRPDTVTISTSSGWKFPLPPQKIDINNGSAHALLFSLQQSLAVAESDYLHTISALEINSVPPDERILREIDAVEKRIQCEQKVLSDIKLELRQNAARKRESKLRRERGKEVEAAAAAAKGNQSESERSYFSSDDEDDEEEDEDEDAEEAGNAVEQNGEITEVDQDSQIEVGMWKETSFTEEIGSFFPGPTPVRRVDTNATIVGLNPPTTRSPILENEEDMTSIYSPSIYFTPDNTNSRVPTIKRSDTEDTIDAITISPEVASRSLARATFGQGYSIPKKEYLESIDDEISTPRYTPPSSTATVLGLGIVTASSSENSDNRSLTPQGHSADHPTVGFPSSESSFSGEEADAQRKSYQLHPAPAQPSPSPEKKEKQEQIVKQLRHRFEEKREMYHQHSTSIASSNNTTINPYDAQHANADTPYQYNHIVHQYNPHQQQQQQQNTTGYGEDSRSTTPPSPQSTPTPQYQIRRKEVGHNNVIRERAISPEGILIASNRGLMHQHNPTYNGNGNTMQEHKVIVEGVELMMI